MTVVMSPNVICCRGPLARSSSCQEGPALLGDNTSNSNNLEKANVNVNVKENVKENVKTKVKVKVKAKAAEKFAVCTLLAIDESYLPGALALACSFRENIPRKKWPNIDLVCMCVEGTRISKSGIALLRRWFDVVDFVAPLRVTPDLIHHRDATTRERYSQMFVKFRLLEMTRYQKILYMDADMLVLRPTLVNLFMLDTPAAVFYGCTNPFKGAHEKTAYTRNVCPVIEHGKTIQNRRMASNESCPRSINGVKTRGKYMGFEAALMLLGPDPLLLQRIESIVRDAQKGVPFAKELVSKTEASLFNRLFATKMHVINNHFLGRWVDAQTVPGYVTLDSYGYMGKPWNVDVPNYSDVVYWRKRYAEYASQHPSTFGVRTPNHTMKQAYRVIVGK